MSDDGFEEYIEANFGGDVQELCEAHQGLVRENGLLAATIQLLTSERDAALAARDEAREGAIEECATIIESWMKWEPKITGVSVAAPGYAAINTTLIRVRNAIRSLLTPAPRETQEETDR